MMLVVCLFLLCEGKRYGVTDGCDPVLFLFVRMTGGSMSDLVLAVVVTTARK